MFYYSGPGDLYRDHGATRSIRMPDSRYVNAAEGFAVVHRLESENFQIHAQ